MSATRDVLDSAGSVSVTASVSDSGMSVKDGMLVFRGEKPGLQSWVH